MLYTVTGAGTLAVAFPRASTRVGGVSGAVEVYVSYIEPSGAVVNGRRKLVDCCRGSHVCMLRGRLRPLNPEYLLYV